MRQKKRWLMQLPALVAVAVALIALLQHALDDSSLDAGETIVSEATPLPEPDEDILEYWRSLEPVHPLGPATEN